MRKQRVFFLIFCLFISCENNHQSPMVSTCDDVEITLVATNPQFPGWCLDVYNGAPDQYDTLWNTGFLIKCQVMNGRDKYTHSGIRFDAKLGLHHNYNIDGAVDVFSEEDGRGYIRGIPAHTFTVGADGWHHAWTDNDGACWFLFGGGDADCFFDGADHDPDADLIFGRTENVCTYAEFTVRLKGCQSVSGDTIEKTITILLEKVPYQEFYGTELSGVYVPGVVDLSCCEIINGGCLPQNISQFYMTTGGANLLPRTHYEPNSIDRPTTTIPLDRTLPSELMVDDPNGSTGDDIIDGDFSRWYSLVFDSSWGWVWTWASPESMTIYNFTGNTDPNDFQPVIDRCFPVAFWARLTGEWQDIPQNDHSAIVRAYDPGQSDPNRPLTEPHEIWRMPVTMRHVGDNYYCSDWIIGVSDPNSAGTYEDYGGKTIRAVYMTQGAYLEILHPHGDINADGNVDYADLSLVSDKWLTSCDPNFYDPNDVFESYDLGMDFDRSGTVDMADIAGMSNEWK